MQRIPIVTCVTVLALGPATIARAAEEVSAPSSASLPSTAAQAIRHAYAGRARFEAADYRGALIEFEQSRALAISPVVDLFIARSHRALGHWLLARQSFRACLSVPPDPSNVAWTEAQRSARSELDELEAKFPRVEVRAPKLAGASRVELRVDGVSHPWPITTSIELDPGAHVLLASFEDQTFSSQVVLSPGETEHVELPFSPPKRPESRQQSSAAGRPARTAATSPGSTHSSDPFMPWIVSSFALSGAGLIMGTIAGIVTLDQAGDVRDYCASAACPGNVPQDPTVAAQRQDALTWSTVSTVSFVTAGVAAVTGGTLLLLRDPERAKADVALNWTGTSLFLEGSF